MHVRNPNTKDDGGNEKLPVSKSQCSERKIGRKTWRVKVPPCESALNLINVDLQPVVLLRNIFAGYTLKKKVTQKRYVKEGRKQSGKRCGESCYKNEAGASTSAMATDNDNLLDRGLRDYKLSQIKMWHCSLVINVNVITDFLVTAVSDGNARNRPHRPFTLPNPREECSAIVDALCIYSKRVSPIESQNLFCSDHDNYCLSSASTGTSGQEANLKRTKRKFSRKGWIYVISLGKSDFFCTMKQVPGRKHAFEKKMVGIMKAGMEVDPNNWTLSEVGYILGYWLAKCYNNQGIPDERLPKELVLAKEHFLELRGWNYDDATVVI